MGLRPTKVNKDTSGGCRGIKNLRRVFNRADLHHVLAGPCRRWDLGKNLAAGCLQKRQRDIVEDYAGTAQNGWVWNGIGGGCRGQIRSIHRDEGPGLEVRGSVG